jgi:hypothetical protein
MNMHVADRNHFSPNRSIQTNLKRLTLGVLKVVTLSSLFLDLIVKSSFVSLLRSFELELEHT